METKRQNAPSICVFDVNETLLDIEYIGPLFQRLFGQPKVLREWFGQLVLRFNVADDKVFEAYRELIEQVASGAYDAGANVDDTGCVLVTSEALDRVSRSA